MMNGVEAVTGIVSATGWRSAQSRDRRATWSAPKRQLWPRWRHFSFITNRTEALSLLEAEHRVHAVVEQVMARLKAQALAHFPSGKFNANGAWTVLGALAHYLLRWTQLIGLPDSTVRAARTIHLRWLQIAGQLIRHGRSWTLHLPGPPALAPRARSGPKPARATDRSRPHTPRRHISTRRGRAVGRSWPGPPRVEAEFVPI